MYLGIVLALMLVLPAACIAGEALFSQTTFSLVLIGKWFVIWSVGARLVLAGLRQTIQPRYTASVILSLKSDESLILVRELGFANLAIGLVGVASAFYPTWRPAGALVGGVFYGLAGANHALRTHRSKHENFAMVSDIWVAAVLLASLGALVTHPT